VMNYSSLYIHFPFCKSKCDYCAFYSTPDHNESLRAAFTQKIISDIEQHAGSLQHLKSVYFGGGTPTLLGPDQLSSIIATISETCSIPEEWTIEANPETLTDEMIAFLSSSLVNRISIGVQSFIAQLREMIGRRGSILDLEDAISKLFAAGLTNISCDLIYGIPGQSMDDWHSDLKHVRSLPFTHLSAYALSIEEQSVLADGRLEVDDEIERAMWLSIPVTSGFERYEISNYALNGKNCQHNALFWRGEEYLGLGPSAVSCDGKSHSTQPRDIMVWLAGETPETMVISAEDRAREILIFMLRTTTGCDLLGFKDKTGFDALDLCGDSVDAWLSNRWIVVTQNKIALTEEGFLWADSVAEEII